MDIKFNNEHCIEILIVDNSCTDSCISKQYDKLISLNKMLLSQDNILFLDCIHRLIFNAETYNNLAEFNCTEIDIVLLCDYVNQKIKEIEKELGV